MADLSADRLNYREKTWQPGELVTATEMNTIENGIADLFNEEQRIVPHYNSAGGTVKVRHSGIPNLFANDNGLTSIPIGQGYGISAKCSDNNARFFSYFMGTARPDGQTVCLMQVRNFDGTFNGTEANSFTNEIAVKVDKSGNCSYYITDPAAFRQELVSNSKTLAQMHSSVSGSNVYNAGLFSVKDSGDNIIANFGTSVSSNKVTTRLMAQEGSVQAVFGIQASSSGVTIEINEATKAALKAELGIS